MLNTILFLAAPIIVGYCLIRYLRIRSDNHHRQVLRQIAENLDLNAEDTQIFEHMLLTFDRDDNSLLYISNYEGIAYRTIYLDQVDSCRLIMKDISIQLEFSYKEPYRASDTIVFYQKYLHRRRKRAELLEEAKKLRNRILLILEDRELAHSSLQ